MFRSSDTEICNSRNTSHTGITYYSQNHDPPAEGSWTTENEHRHQQIYFADSVESHDDRRKNQMTH